MVVPVPGFASRIRRSSSVGGGELADSVDEVVTLIAGRAGTGSVMRGAVVADRHTNSISVEDPVG